ncbi:MAG: branched-chain amino acid aminotransferase [Clostridia bacterium]
MEIRINRTSAAKPMPHAGDKLGFCRQFSDHMFIVEYDDSVGWHDARITPYAPFTIDPASPVLHYGQEIFEGLKAYRRDDGEIQLFRARDNASRMNRSAARMCIPSIDEELQFSAMQTIVDIERDWVPSGEGESLYLRPTCIADGNTLGVHAASRYIYYIICSPSGSYYPNGLEPIRIHIESRDVRAVKGGIGFAKTGGNYAASLRAAEAAKQNGFDQVLWLDGRENRYVEEVGAMNIMFMLGDTLVTAELGGSILPGITRDSVLALARERGIKVEERRIAVDELVAASKRGDLLEAFGTGTAAVISPIREMTFDGVAMKVGDGKSIGKVAREMYDTLTGIQTGKSADTHGWISVVPHLSR